MFDPLRHWIERQIWLAGIAGLRARDRTGFSGCRSGFARGGIVIATVHRQMLKKLCIRPGVDSRLLIEQNVNKIFSSALDNARSTRPQDPVRQSVSRVVGKPNTSGDCQDGPKACLVRIQGRVCVWAKEGKAALRLQGRQVSDNCLGGECPRSKEACLPGGRQSCRRPAGKGAGRWLDA